MLSADSAARLIKIGYVKVGWIRAKMRVCEDIKRSYLSCRVPGLRTKKARLHFGYLAAVGSQLRNTEPDLDILIFEPVF